ncbi:hypothetical protein [Marivita sp.]|uniref:hypothetical protein n=1 Tax=Marivita sp. TaxID=2003365 RepID=UPI0025B7C894|nr:hypothetical protein [Marivita sp.]
MTPPEPTPVGLTTRGIILRLAGLLIIVVLATWGSHLLKDALNLTIMPNNEEQMHRLLMLGSLAYIGLLAMPFVPGAEIGLAMLTIFGAAIAPLVYAATVLAYLLGRVLPGTTLVWILSLFRMRKAADLIGRAAALPPTDRLTLLLDGSPPMTVSLAVRHRYIALALLVNTPGNAVIGGGGGIMMMAGMSGIFAPVQTFIAIAIAVSPVPIAIMVLGF